MGRRAGAKRKTEPTIDYEAEMEQVTVHPPREEVLVDPHMLADVLEGTSEDFRHYLTTSPEMVIERWDQTERLRCIAARKLAGREREIVLTLLGSGCNQTEVAELLGISRETVRVHLARAEEKLREHFEPRGETRFAAEEGHDCRAALFPLDTGAERERFQAFINDHEIRFIAYGVNGDFREALVIHEGEDR